MQLTALETRQFPCDTCRHPSCPCATHLVHFHPKQMCMEWLANTWVFGKYPYRKSEQRHIQLLRLSRVLDTLSLTSLQALIAYRSAPHNGTNNTKISYLLRSEKYHNWNSLPSPFFHVAPNIMTASHWPVFIIEPNNIAIKTPSK